MAELSTQSKYILALDEMEYEYLLSLMGSIAVANLPTNLASAQHSVWRALFNGTRYGKVGFETIYPTIEEG